MHAAQTRWPETTSTPQNRPSGGREDLAYDAVGRDTSRRAQPPTIVVSPLANRLVVPFRQLALAVTGCSFRHPQRVLLGARLTVLSSDRWTRTRPLASMSMAPSDHARWSIFRSRDPGHIVSDAAAQTYRIRDENNTAHSIGHLGDSLWPHRPASAR